MVPQSDLRPFWERADGKAHKQRGVCSETSGGRVAGPRFLSVPAGCLEYSFPKAHDFWALKMR